MKFKVLKYIRNEAVPKLDDKSLSLHLQAQLNKTKNFKN